MDARAWTRTASTRMCAYVLTKCDCTDPIVGEMCQTEIRFIVCYAKLLLYIRYITYIYIYIRERSRSCALAKTYMCMDMYACMRLSFARLV